MKTTIEHKLTEAFCPTYLAVIDESHKHAGHKGALEHGGGHYRVTIVSEKFRTLNAIKRHRLVYDCLTNDMHGIHALAIKAYAPEEFDQ